jgi:hypothetical protein
MTTAIDHAADRAADRALSATLAERIADTVPPSHLEFAKLLGLLDVEVSRDVATAAVTSGARSRLLLNPDFVARHCRTDAALVMLVLHELNHIVLGHTRLYPRTTPARNFIFDALVNAQLCRALPRPAYTALFRELYAHDRFPEALLRPPVGWRTANESWRMTGKALVAHRALYAGDTVTHADLVEVLEESLGCRRRRGRAKASLELPPLLGNHDAGSPGDDEGGGVDPALLETLRRVVAHWPAEVTLAARGVGAGRGQGGDPGAAFVEAREARRDVVRVIRLALLRVAGDQPGSAPSRGARDVDVESALPYRTVADRRAGVREAFGAAPVMFRAVRRAREPDPGSLVHVYLDVSGSMTGVIALLYGALAPLRALLYPRIHLFSTTLHDISPAELVARKVVGDGGTDIRCVTAHMLAEGVRRAVVITDGYVGSVPEEHRRELRERRLQCVVLLAGSYDRDLAGVLGKEVLPLPRLVDGG